MDPIQATFEHGVFRPITPVVLPEGCQVEVRVLAPDEGSANSHLSGNGDGPTIEDQLRQIAGALPPAAWQQLPPDLSDHIDHYVYGGD
jgi:predicted DNA-binding antitoxin AbrB/MazE fold protein